MTSSRNAATGIASGGRCRPRTGRQLPLSSGRDSTRFRAAGKDFALPSSGPGVPAVGKRPMDGPRKRPIWMDQSVAPLAVLLLVAAAAGCGLRPRNFRKITHPAPLVRARALGLAGSRPDVEVVPALIARLSDSDPVVRLAAHEELKRRTGTDFGYLPWAGLEERTRAVERWRSWFSGGSRHDGETTAPGALGPPRASPQAPPQASPQAPRRASPPRSAIKAPQAALAEPQETLTPRSTLAEPQETLTPRSTPSTPSSPSS